MSSIHNEFELQDSATMDKVRSLFRRQPRYEPVENGDRSFSEDVDEDGLSQASSTTERDEKPFLWIEYSVFFLLGIAMLWAWYFTLENLRSN